MIATDCRLHHLTSMQIEQASAEVKERDARIQALEAKLRQAAGKPTLVD